MIVIPLEVQRVLAEEGFSVTDLAGTRVTMDDVRRAGFCLPGLKDWLAAHGFDMRTLVNPGLSAAQLAATGDAYAVMGVIRALKRRAADGR